MPAPRDFLGQWVEMADKLVGLAAEDEAAGRLFSAARQAQARRALLIRPPSACRATAIPAARKPMRKALASLPARATRSAARTVERVEIPYEGERRCPRC